MHAYGKINNTVHSGYASYSRGTETAEVEGPWLARDPNTVSKHPDDSNNNGSSPLAWSYSPFIFPPNLT